MFHVKQNNVNAMKTKELMIGDIILIETPSETGCLPIRIQEVAKECILVDLGEGLEEIDDYFVKPMPITAKILEKNAKSVEKDGYRIYYEFNNNFAVKKFSGAFFFCELENGFLGKGEIKDNTWTDIDYIHELQHALRLVGLNEIADNIKI